MLVSLNEPVLKGYLEAAAVLRDTYGLSDDLSVTAAMRLPDVLTVDKEEEDEDELRADVSVILEEALAGYSEMSRKEGARLKEDIVYRVSLIAGLVDQVEQRSPKCVEEYREKLEARMMEVLESASIDPQRILTEAAIFADKVAVTEEIVRLRSHLAQLGNMLEAGGAVGRKLDFLVQELNREANTIGSKANDVEVAQMCGGYQGGDRKNPRTGTEYRIAGGGKYCYEINQYRIWKHGVCQPLDRDRQPGVAGAEYEPLSVDVNLSNT